MRAKKAVKTVKVTGVSGRLLGIDVRPADGMLYAVVSDGSIVFYRDEGFRGNSFTADGPVADFRAGGFNDRASSAVVI